MIPINELWSIFYWLWLFCYFEAYIYSWFGDALVTAYAP